jgi:hypothetical protein
MRHIKRIYDFFRLWFKWKDAREAWQDSGTLNDPKFKDELQDFDKAIEDHLNRRKK